MTKTMMTLFARDLRKAMNLRAFLIWAALAGMGVFFFFATGAKTQLLENDRIDYMSLFLPHMIFGAWAVLSVYFDLISADRQHNVLDCILSSGVSKATIFLSKTMLAMVMSLILSIIYLLPLAVVVTGLTGDVGHAGEILLYILPLWGHIMVYASMGVLISVIARSSKAALIWSLAAGLLLMPRLFVMMVEGVGNAFGWTADVIRDVSLIAPGVMVQALSETSESSRFALAAKVFAVSVLVFFALGYVTFLRQDEWNYGE